MSAIQSLEVQTWQPQVSAAVLAFANARPRKTPRPASLPSSATCAWTLTHKHYGPGAVLRCNYTESGTPSVHIRFNGGTKHLLLVPEYWAEPIADILRRFERMRPRPTAHRAEITPGDVLLRKKPLPDLAEGYADELCDSDGRGGWDLGFIAQSRSAILRALRYTPPKHRKDAVERYPIFRNLPERQLETPKVFREQANQWRRIELTDVWVSSRASDALGSGRVFLSRANAGTGLPVSSVTPGRAIKDALNRHTELSLSCPRGGRDSYDGFTEPTTWEETLDMTSATCQNPVATGEDWTPPETNPRKKRAYLTPRQREMLSVVRMKQQTRPDGQFYRSADIARTLKKTPMSPAKVKRLSAEASKLMRENSDTGVQR